jgi:hypothetical protein
MEYYVLLQSHIAEADKTNIEDMSQVLPRLEREEWSLEQGRTHPIVHRNSFSTVVDQRLEHVTTLIANSEQLVLPKPIPIQARLHRSPSVDC